MKLLLDMNLPPSLTATLRSAGFSVVHWSDEGDPRAADTTGLDWRKPTAMSPRESDSEHGGADDVWRSPRPG